MSYLISGIIIFIIVIWQFQNFKKLKNRLSAFYNIFPVKNEDYEFKKDQFAIEIPHHPVNSVLGEIISSINNYLYNNKSTVSDFHLIKDIVDRNCDALEEEISTQVPIPLYLGLAGTMVGILLGLGFLVFSGGINALLDVGQAAVGSENGHGGTGAEGIEALLGGVALAMTSSITGIIFTTYGSVLVKNVKSKVEKNKNTFFSWIQAELMPKLTDSTATAIGTMTKNLTEFNNTFGRNTADLNKALSTIYTTSEQQVELLNLIKNIDVRKMAKANIEVYQALSKSTQDLEVFGRFLTSSQEHIQRMALLNIKLDQYEKRTQVIESAGAFFSKNETWFSDNIDSAKLKMTDANTRLLETLSENSNKLSDCLNSQILAVKKLIEEQKTALNESIKEQNKDLKDSLDESQKAFSATLEALQEKMTTALETEFKKSTEGLNKPQIGELLHSINEHVAKFNYQGQRINQLSEEVGALTKATNAGLKIKIPIWLKILIVAVGAGIVFYTIIAAMLLQGTVGFTIN